MGRDLSGLRTPKIVWGGFLNEDMVGEKKKKTTLIFHKVDAGVIILKWIVYLCFCVTRIGIHSQKSLYVMLTL